MDKELSIEQKRADIRDSLYFQEVIRELFRECSNGLNAGGLHLSPQALWVKMNTDLIFKHLRSYRETFRKHWNLFTADEQAILHDFITKSEEYERDWRENHDHSMRCPMFLDLGKVLKK
jgi:hypothetical protein